MGTPDSPAGELPLLDKSLDSYCVARLQDEHGVLYPLGGVRSRVAYRSTRPAWREGLELPLRGRTHHEHPPRAPTMSTHHDQPSMAMSMLTLAGRAGLGLPLRGQGQGVT